jgi:peptidyl-prolyl cis-trans isomerase B (cyclophilin B)
MSENPQVVIKISMGDITVELFPELTPEKVENFLNAVSEEFYSGTIFHRVIKGFMIQGGGLDDSMRDKKWNHKPVQNEAKDAMPNERGTIAMARTNDPHSATMQFFINTADNGSLNYRTPYSFDYCVFGMVTDGMDVFDAIEGLPTASRLGHDDVPKEAVTITEVVRLA